MPACACCRASPATRSRSPRRASPQGSWNIPHYTRPREWEGRAIPEVLLSGDHEKIAKWRREQAEAITKARRPDLWERYAQAEILIEVSALRVAGR